MRVCVQCCGDEPFFREYVWTVVVVNCIDLSRMCVCVSVLHLQAVAVMSSIVVDSAQNTNQQQQL